MKEKKKLQSKILYLTRLPFKTGAIKSFPDKQNLKSLLNCLYNKCKRNIFKQKRNGTNYKKTDEGKNLIGRGKCK